MPAEIPTHTNPEKREGIPDDARKFIVDKIDPSLLEGDSVTSFLLTTNWQETGENDEKKIAHKKYPDGKVEMLRIEKVRTKEGKRDTKKRKIQSGEYAEYLGQSTVKVEKKRYEFTLEQNGVVFDAKYDEFVGPNNLRILEVDALTEEIRNAFDPTTFPGELTEVTGDRSYEGYRVADHL